MAILYIGESRRKGFMDAIDAMCGGEESYTATSLDEARACLPHVNAVVLVGRQEGIFGTENIYRDYLRRAHESGAKVLAVVEKGDSLPDNNAGLDKVIESCRRTTSITSIGHQITAQTWTRD